MESVEYYVTKLCGSLFVKKPTRRIFKAGENVPIEYLKAMPEAEVRSLLVDKLLVEKVPNEMVDLGEVPTPDPIGAGDGKFMPEVSKMPGKRVDAELDRIKREQDAKRESEVDHDQGGSIDGVVKVEAQADEDELAEMGAEAEAEGADFLTTAVENNAAEIADMIDDGELTDAERKAIAEMEAAEREL